jgi:hypothetical protein
MSFQRSALGRLLGYGEFIVESAGEEQALRTIDFLPYPDQLYLEVCGLTAWCAIRLLGHSRCLRRVGPGNVSGRAERS